MAKFHSMMALTVLVSGGLLQTAGANQAHDSAAIHHSGSGSSLHFSATNANFSASSESAAQFLQLAENYTGPAEAAPRKLVEVKSDQGIRYVSGGVGETERDALNALSDQFNLRLIFAMADNGAYLAAVRVNITNASGEQVLSAVSEGPWFFAQLEPGKYTVDVSVVGGQDQVAQEPQQKTVQVDGSGQSVVRFLWS